MIIREYHHKEGREYVKIKCDLCPTLAPPAEEIMKAHGLINMGWYCKGGTHICPDHEHPK
jgi:hypothetical protein